MLLFIFAVSTMIALILIMLNSIMGTKMSSEREKMSAFECGFDPKSLSRLPFSLHFFLVALIFLIFDVEITLILPIPITFGSVIPSYWEYISVILVIILAGGTLIEWMEGSLDWAY